MKVLDTQFIKQINLLKNIFFMFKYVNFISELVIYEISFDPLIFFKFLNK
jgi:hypothetical protein